MSINQKYKKQIIAAAIAAAELTADKRQSFIKWPNNMRIDPTWGFSKLDHSMISDIVLLVLTAGQTLDGYYDDRRDKNNAAYRQSKKQPAPQPIPKQPIVDEDDEDDDSFLDTLDDDDSEPIPAQDPPRPKQTSQPDIDDDLIMDMAELYPKGTQVWWPSKRYGKLAMQSGVVVGKRKGTLSNFVVVKSDNGAVITLDPNTTKLQTTKPTLVGKLTSFIMGESVERFLK